MASTITAEYGKDGKPLIPIGFRKAGISDAVNRCLVLYYSATKWEPFPSCDEYVSSLMDEGRVIYRMDPQPEFKKEIPTVYRRKIHPIHFRDILNGTKNWELRKEDREVFEDFRFLDLYEWNPESEEYTGRCLHTAILSIHRGIEGIEPGFAMLSIRVLGAYTTNENEGI